MRSDLALETEVAPERKVEDRLAPPGEPSLVAPATEPGRVTGMLTEEQVRARLAINSPELVAELYALVQGQLAGEASRQTRIDAKATSLLTAAGLSLTVAFTFGSMLISGNGALRFSICIVSIFGLTLVAGLGAALHAVWALLVRGGYQVPDGDALFDEEVLSNANDPMKDDVDEKDEDKLTEKEKRDFGVMEYRKFLIPNLWGILRSHRIVHKEKAAIVQRGQGLFFAFLVLAIVCCIAVVLAVSKGHDGSKAPPGNTSETSAASPTGQ